MFILSKGVTNGVANIVFLPRQYQYGCPNKYQCSFFNRYLSSFHRGLFDQHRLILNCEFLSFVNHLKYLVQVGSD